MTGSASFSWRPQSRWPTFDTRNAAQVHPRKNSRERTPSKTRNPARPTATDRRRGRGSLQGYSRLCAAPQAPLHRVLLLDCFSPRLGVRFITTALKSRKGGGDRIYVTVMRNIFAALSLSVYCIPLCLCAPRFLLSIPEEYDPSGYFFFVVG